MNNNSSLPTSTFEPISNIRLTKMPSRPQPRDKLYESDGVRFRISERYVYKPRLNARSAWQLYDGVTIPKKEELILVGNPNLRTSKLVYILADQAEYSMLDISEIPFVTRATTRNIISAPAHMRFGYRSNNFQFTFDARGTAAVAASQPQTPPTQQPQPQSQSESISPVAACIAAITSYFTGPTAQKRSRETFEGDDQANCRRPGPDPYRRWLLRTVILMDQ